jgi:caa(3)-type oxidase subunit IV
MSANADIQVDSEVSHDDHHLHPDSYYIKIWVVLLVLLIISISGPELGIKVVTLITAFGIAIVKAYIVATEFMHLKIEKKIVTYIMFTMLLLMGIFYSGVAPDVQAGKGSGWHLTSPYEGNEETWCTSWGCPSEYAFCDEFDHNGRDTVGCDAHSGGSHGEGGH